LLYNCGTKFISRVLKARNVDIAISTHTIKALTWKKGAIGEKIPNTTLEGAKYHFASIPL
jgi:hypothetical protein